MPLLRLTYFYHICSNYDLSLLRLSVLRALTFMEPRKIEAGDLPQASGEWQFAFVVAYRTS